MCLSLCPWGSKNLFFLFKPSSLDSFFDFFFAYLARFFFLLGSFKWTSQMTFCFGFVTCHNQQISLAPCFVISIYLRNKRIAVWAESCFFQLRNQQEGLEVILGSSLLPSKVTCLDLRISSFTYSVSLIH